MGAKANAITNSMIKSMGMVAQAKATGLNYDRTQQMVVVAIEDADKNSYKVSDGNTTFVAFGADDVKYRVNDSVYVKIPTGNTTGRKIIIGKYTVENEAATHSNSPLFNMIRMKDIEITSGLPEIVIEHKKASEKTVDIELGDWIKKQGPFGFYDYIGIDIYFDNKGIKNNTEGQYSAEIIYGKKTSEEIIPELFHPYVDFNINSRGLYGNPNAITKFFKHTFYCDKDNYNGFIYQPLNLQGGDDYTEVLRITLATNDTWDENIYEEDRTIAISKIVLWFSYDKNRFDKDQVYLYLERLTDEKGLAASTGRCYVIQNQELLSGNELSNLSLQRGYLNIDSFGEFFNRWKWEDLTLTYPVNSLNECFIDWMSEDLTTQVVVTRLVYQYDNSVFYSPYLLSHNFNGYYKGAVDYTFSDDERNTAFQPYLYWILDVQFIKELGYQENNQYQVPYYYYVNDITEDFKGHKRDGEEETDPDFSLKYSVYKILDSDLLNISGFNLIVNDNQEFDSSTRVVLKALYTTNPSYFTPDVRNRYLDLGIYNNDRITQQTDSGLNITSYYYNMSNQDNYLFPLQLPESYKHLLTSIPEEPSPYVYWNNYRTDNDDYSFEVQVECKENMSSDKQYYDIFDITFKFQEYYNITTGYASEPQIYLDKYGSFGPTSNFITITPKVMQRGFPQMTLGDFFSTYTIGCTWTPSSKIVVDKGNNSTITITSPFEYEIDRKNNSIIVSKSENLKLYDSNIYEMDKIIENHCVLMITVDGTIKFTDKIFHYEFYYPIGISNMGYNISEPTVKYKDIIKMSMSKNWTLIDTNGAMVPDITWQIKFKNRTVPFNYEINGTDLGNVIVSDVNMSSIDQSWHITDKDKVNIKDDNNYNGKHMLEGYDKNNKLVWLSPFYAEPW